MSNFLDSTGLSHLIEKIKTSFISKTDTTTATTVSIETIPTNNSTNLVTSGGVYTALSGKQNTIDSSHKLSADLVSDGTTNKVFTSTEKTKLSGIASGAEVNVQADWNVTSTTSDAYIKNKPTIPDAQIQSDWNQTTTTAKDYIKNKPSIPTKVSDLTNDAGYTTNTGTITGITMNGASKGTSGIVDLGTVLTEHQDISGKADDSSVIHKTGNEVISGAKTLIAGSQLKLQDSWSQIYNEDDDETLGSVLNSKLSITGTAKKAAAIPWGQLDSTSTATVMTATVPGITALEDGVAIMLKNGVVTSGTNFTLNINNLGAKNVYTNLAAATKESSKFNINYTMLFVYDSTRVSGGGWVLYNGYDSNTNTIGYQLRTNSSVMTVTDTAKYYKLYFTSANTLQWVPASVDSSNNVTTARTPNQRPINPFGPIVYTSANTNYASGANLAATTIWQQYAFNLGYSFGPLATSMTSNKPVYLKCAPQTDGSAIIDSTTPVVQALPSTEDGKIYIFLGIATSASNIELNIVHPVYYYKDFGIRIWTGTDVMTNEDAEVIANALIQLDNSVNQLDSLCLKTSEYQGGVIARSGETLSTGIIVGNSSGYINAASNVIFDQSYSILYYNDGISYDSHSNVAQTGALGTGEMWYLKCSKNGINLTINSITSTVPSNSDNFVYIPLGNSKTSGTIEFKSCNQLFAYSDGKFKECSELIMNLDYRESTGNSITLYEGEIVDCGVISNPSFDIIVGGNDIGEYRAFFTCGLTEMSLTFNDVVINWKEIPQMTLDSVYEVNILRVNNKFYGIIVKYE